MIGMLLVHQFIARSTTRQFSSTSIMHENKSPEPNVEKPDVSRVTNGVKKGRNISTHMYRVNNFDRFVLVWLKRYPNWSEVPKDVTVDCITQVRSRLRIRVCNMLIVGSTIFFVWTALKTRKELTHKKDI